MRRAVDTSRSPYTHLRGTRARGMPGPAMSSPVPTTDTIHVCLGGVATALPCGLRLPAASSLRPSPRNRSKQQTHTQHSPMGGEPGSPVHANVTHIAHIANRQHWRKLLTARHISQRLPPLTRRGSPSTGVAPSPSRAVRVVCLEPKHRTHEWTRGARYRPPQRSRGGRRIRGLSASS